MSGRGLGAIDSAYRGVTRKCPKINRVFPVLSFSPFSLFYGTYYTCMIVRKYIIVGPTTSVPQNK